MHLAPISLEIGARCIRHQFRGCAGWRGSGFRVFDPQRKRDEFVPPFRDAPEHHALDDRHVVSEERGVRRQVLAVRGIHARRVDGHQTHPPRVEPRDGCGVDRREVRIPSLGIGIRPRGDHDALRAERHTARQVMHGDRATARAFDTHHDARAHVEIERLPIDRPAALAVVHRRVSVAPGVHRGGDCGKRDVVALLHVHQLATLERRVTREHGHARGEHRGDVDDAGHGGQVPLRRRNAWFIRTTWPDAPQGRGRCQGMQPP
jgi:hypothetical protein